MAMKHKLGCLQEFAVDQTHSKLSFILILKIQFCRLQTSKSRIIAASSSVDFSRTFPRSASKRITKVKKLNKIPELAQKEGHIEANRYP